MGLAAVAVLLAVAIVAGALAKTAADRADQEAARAERQSVSADARRLGAEALRTPDLDRAMLLAVAGTRLDDSPGARSNLAAVLDRAPLLIGVTKVPAPNTVAVHPDGRTVATTGWEAGLTIVSTETRKVVGQNHDIPLYGMRINPNGSQLAAAVNVSTRSGERRVDPLPLRMFDARTAALAATQLGGMPTGLIVQKGLAFSNNGAWLAAAFVDPNRGDDATSIRVWGTGTLARPAAAFTLPELISNIAVSDDGTRVYVSGDEVHTLDMAGRILRSTPGRGLALSPDGATLVVSRDRQVALLDPERLTVKSVIEEDEGIGEFWLSPTGERLGYQVGEETLVVRSLADPAAPVIRLNPPPRSIKPGRPLPQPREIGFTPDGRTLWTHGPDHLLAYDLAGDRRFVRAMPVEPPHASAVTFLAVVSPDGRAVANWVAGDSQSFGVHLLDVATGTRTPQSALTASTLQYGDLFWRPDSAVVASTWSDQWVHLWDGTTGRPAGRHRVPDEYGVVDTVRFSGDSTRLVVGTRKGWVYAADASTLKVLGRPVLVKADLPTQALAANGDGTRALVRIDGRLQLLDLMQGQSLRTVDPGFDPASFVWTPDGKAVVVVGFDASRDGDGTVAFLDSVDLSTMSVESGPHIPVGEFFQFSPDGERLLNSGGGHVGLWDVTAARLLGSVAVQGFAGFAPGANEVLIASTDGGVARWDPHPEAAVTAACRIAGRELTPTEWATYLPNHEREPVCGT